MRFRSQSRLGRLIITGILLILASCGGHSAGRTYRIGLGPWVGFGPLYLAQEKGFFREQGINTELIVLTGLAERNSALKSNRIDALAAPVDSFVLAAGNGIAVKIVMTIDESDGGDGIVAKKSIRSFEDLRGKRVAFQRGLPSEFFLRALLEDHKMRLNDLKAVDMETAQAGAAFISNQLDAAGLWEPWLTRAAEEGNGHILASSRQFPNLIVDCLAFTGKAVEQRPEDVQKIVDAVLKAIEYWKSNPADADRIMAPHFQVDASKYAKLIDGGAKFCDLARNRTYFGADTPGPIFQTAQRASQIWLDAKVIPSAVSPNSVLTTKFVQEAR
jgi:NitT/TauT family transport system substrate-binding protein